MSIIHLGRWQDTLADVEPDAVICDPPFGKRTHAGQKHKRNDGSTGIATTGLNYDHWTPRDVAVFVAHWSERTSGWMACLTSHDLIPAWEAAFRANGRYVFAPVPCVMRGMTVRLQGDGPSSWTVHLMVARHRTRAAMKWRTLQGAYVGPRDSARLCKGGKPLWLIRDIVRDYSNEGDLICDPMAGGGTAAVVAAEMGRRFIGAELNPATNAAAVSRLAGA